MFCIYAEIARKNKISTEEALATKLVFGTHKVPVMEQMVMQASKLEFTAAKPLWAGNVSKRLKLVRNKLQAHFKVTLDASKKEVEPTADACAKTLSDPSLSAEEALVVDDGASGPEIGVRRSTRNRKTDGLCT